MSEIISERLKKLIAEKRYSKAEISERLGIGYSTLWRRLNGERSVNIDFLRELASVLDTSVAYLIGETDNPVPPNAQDVSKLSSSDELSKETLHQEMPGHLVFRHGDYCVDVPDTPSNQAWFKELTANLLMAGVAVG